MTNLSVLHVQAKGLAYILAQVTATLCRLWYACAVAGCMLSAAGRLGFLYRRPKEARFGLAVLEG